MTISVMLQAVPVILLIAIACSGGRLINASSAAAADQLTEMAFSEDTANGVRREGVDTALQKYAFMTLSSPHVHTGVIYNVTLPPTLDGIECQAMRVRAGSARRRGLVFNEFSIPRGLLLQMSGGPFMVMVYRKILNFTLYSPPAAGFAFASPVVGIVVYTNPSVNFNDSSAMPEMSLTISTLPDDNSTSSNSSTIRADLAVFDEYVDGILYHGDLPASCAFFDINGTASFAKPAGLNSSAGASSVACSSKTLMDVALVVPAGSGSAPVPSPAAGNSNALASSSRCFNTESAIHAISAAVISSLSLTFIIMV